MATPGGLRSWAQKIGLLAGSLVFLAIVLEIALRIAWDGYYPKFDPERPLGEFTFHPERGVTPAPGVEKFDWTKEFGIWQRHNSLGFRGPEIEVEKPAGRTRVLVVGDSQTYGTGVENDETFSAVLERLAPRLQVINAGVGGYGTDLELLMLREWTPVLRPDIVLVAFFWNDLYEVRMDRYARAELRDGEVVFVPPEPASLDHPFFAEGLREHRKLRERYNWLRLESRLYRFLSDRLKVLDYATREWRGRGTKNFRFPFHLEPDEERQAWELVYGLLREMRDVARGEGARFAVMVIPDQVEVEPDVVVYGVPDVLYEMQDLLRAFGEREGIVVLDPEASLHRTRAEQGEPLYFRIDRHLNPTGHHRLAEWLQGELEALGWIPDRA